MPRVSEYLRFFMLSTEAMAIADPFGCFKRVNPAFVRLTGFDEQELVSRPFLDFVLPADRERTAREMELQVAVRPSLAFENRYVRKDGSVIHLAWTAYFDAEEGVTYATASNLTDRRLAEKERSKFRLGLDRSDDAIFLTAPDGTIEYVNHAFEKLYGFAAAEAIGKTPRILKSGTAPPGTYEGFWATLLARQVVQGEIVNKTKDGRMLLIEASANPILDDGEIVGFLAIQRDISERKRAAEERETLREQLRQSQKLEAIGSLAGGVAHDFNNILSVVLSYADLLSADLRPGDPMRVDLAEITAAGRRATDLTRQLLAFSRKQVLQPRLVDLGAVVRGMEKMLRRLLGEDVEVTLTIPPSLANVMVDPGQIEQVIMNLATNARDAMPRGGEIRIEAAEVDLDERGAAAVVGATSGRHVSLTVSDTGAGMDHATQARIFEPFFTTKPVGKGTGLGLSTVFGIVKQSGGTIGVQSEPGKGTRFVLHFPVADGTARAAADASAPTERSALRGHETVLLVEDEESVRLLVRAILRRFGYEVLDAQSGGDALLLCEQHPTPIHLLLTDVVMPRMNGRELAERLALVRPEMKVLYMSGYANDAVVRLGATDSTIAFIEKPLMPEALARKVREVLGPARDPR